MIFELLDFSGDSIFNSLDIILISLWVLMARVFYKTVVKKVI